jgi:8-oxo-dGTP pyrophosphatase MutT (NUDIX family)
MSNKDIELFHNPFITVFHRETPDGYLYTVVKPRLGEGSSVIPMIPASENNPESRFLVVSQYRPPINGISWEFPAGGIDENETAFTTAIRELEEETNVIVAPEHLYEVGQFHNAPSLAEDLIHLFIAVLPEDYDEKNVICQESEILDYKWLTISELIHNTLNDKSYNMHIISQLVKAKVAGHITDELSF